MARQPPSGPWGPSAWRPTLLAASILSSCLFQLLATATAIDVTFKPSKPIEGQDVTLTPGGSPIFYSCKWYRDSAAETNKIFLYFPPLPTESSKQENGPGHTGRETAGEDCSLHISNLRPNDTGIYIVIKEGREIETQRGEISIVVSEHVTYVNISGPYQVVEHMNASLNCSSDGTEVSYVWLKDSQLLETGERITFGDNNQTLILRDVWWNDTGNYACYGYNFFSNASASYWLNVIYGPLEPEISPKMHDFAEGSVLNISCYANSNPPATYTWFYNETEEVSNSFQLVIPNLSSRHAGNYSCTAFNNETNQSSSVNWNVRVLQNVSNVILSALDQAIENRNASLNCSSDGTDVSYFWLKDSQLLGTGARVTLSNNNQTLTLSSAWRNDTGNYTCYGYNLFSNASASYWLNVLYGPDDPEISPKIHDFAEDSVLNISCYANSNPPATYTWFYNETVEVSNSSQLIIPNLSSHNAGNYSCTAFNNETNQSSSVNWNVRVLQKVSNVTINGPSESNEGSSVTLICSSKGSEVSYYWFKANQIVEAGDHVQLIDGNLTLTPVNRSDAGSYTCLGNNSVSHNTSDSFQLVVFYGPDAPIISPSEQNFVVGFSVTLSCEANSNPPATYTWLTSGVVKVENASVLQLSDLTFNDSRIYTCRAFNNKTGSAHLANKKISVWEKLSSPGLWRSPENMVAENKVVIFFCSASFKFNVTISWYKDDEFVKGMPGAPNQNQTLVIESVTREHEGSYRCVVSNPGNNVTSRSVVLKVASAGGGNGGVSPGAIAGIVIGSLAGAVLVGGLIYFVVTKSSLGRTEQHASNGNISSQRGRNVGVTDTKPTSGGDGDIQYTTVAFNSVKPPASAQGTPQPLESNTVYSEIKK